MPQVRIDCILFDGKAKRTESDEYVQITNYGESAQDLLGWKLQDAHDEHQVFEFRSSYVLPPGATIRVYTNEIHDEWGGFSFGKGRSIWNNSEADTAVLLDETEHPVSEATYDVKSPPGCSD